MLTECKPVFIVGAPRSGTSWLQIMLGAHPQVSTTYELMLFEHYISPVLRLWKADAERVSNNWKRGLPTILNEEEYRRYLDVLLATVFEKLLAQKPGATHVLEKTPAHCFHVHEIKEMLPDALFVHIIRDGRDVFCSQKAASRDMNFGMPTEAAKGADSWKRHVNAAREARVYEGSYMELRYCDLLEHGERELRRIMDFCNLPATDQEIAQWVRDHQFDKMKSQRKGKVEGEKSHPEFYRKGKTGTWQEEMTVAERYQFDCIAGDLLRELGYAENGWWRRDRLDAVRIASLKSRRKVQKLAGRFKDLLG